MTRISRLRRFGPSLIVLTIGVVFLLWAQIYPRNTGTVPTLVAILTIALGLLDLAGQSDTGLGRTIAKFVGRAGEEEEPKKTGWRPVLFSVLWPLGYVAATIYAGFLLVTPLYIFLYMWTYGGKSLLASAVSATVTTVSIWLTFEVLFRYPLYPGVLFGGYL
ncbi:MAG TPA: tripartite tricarboxylate transporter TctB family protein [Hyphomicrobiaceae bacterium]|nr:tripartite tricarboxylate transporter TctB family protein [Hyphomicrobiaceae bacterium]